MTNTNESIIWPTAGIIILNDQMETVLVETPRGNFSFPKGGREKGETIEECAFRELYEETGIKRHQITIIKDVEYDEYSPKNKPAVKYYIATLNDYKNHVFKFDPEELVSCGWYKIDDIINGTLSIKPARKVILAKIKSTLTK
jgi:8-oxo-dGTP pyrophosphatase MutT (NUDIX family)